MKIIILTLLFGLMGYTISKPTDSKAATEALVEKTDWQTAALQAWPLQPAPLTAYTTQGLNLLTPGQLLQQNENKEKVQLTAVAAPMLQATTTSTHFGNFLMPQYLNQQQQYLAFNRGFFQAPFTQYGYTAGQQYVPQFYAAIPALTPSVVETPEKQPAPAPIPRTTTTKRPVFKDREPTTRKPQATIKIQPEKLQNNAADFKSDVALLKAVRNINPKYVIEEIVNVPGQHIYSAKTTEKKAASNRKSIQLEKKPEKSTDTATSAAVKVEATGKTSTKGTIPEIPYDTYFLPYFSQGQQLQQQTAKKPAALILEPHSKAIVGNGGTAISTPISRAYLKRGVTTNVYFNPESVAIAGVGGKAHAQADLELDLIK